MTRALRSQHATLAGALALLALSAPHASAQVVVLRIDPAAESVSEELEAALEPWGVVPDAGYLDEAERLGLDPASDSALFQLTPAAEARLALVPRGHDERRVYVEFRDGTSGAGFGVANIPLEDGELEARGRRVLAAEVARRIGPPPLAAEEGVTSAAGDGAEAVEAAAGGSDSGETALNVRVFAGAGIGARDVTWPAPGERRSVETGPFAAVELGASILFAFGESFWFGPVLAYQTSFAHEVEEQHISGQSDTLRVRSHRFDAVIAGSIGLGSAGFRLTPAIGVAVQNFRPEVHHLLTPTYSLAGPLARISLRIPFGSTVALRIAPEAQILFTDDALRELGASNSGVAIGGEIAMELGIASSLSLELTARDARAWVESKFGDDATDAGLFATTRLVWQP